MSRAQIETFSNYNLAWSFRNPLEGPVLRAQAALPGIRQLQPRNPSRMAEVAKHYRRGALTLELIRRLPVSTMPELAVTSTLWLPVQAYYAAHGFGLALFAALDDRETVPGTHRAFIEKAGVKIVERFFPTPLSAVLRGGYRGFEHLQEDLSGLPGADICISPNFNVQKPGPLTRDSHVVQCLSTTRRDIIESSLQRKRDRSRSPGKQRGFLQAALQSEVANSTAPTTVFDYLYRVRQRSNYEDVAMFQEGNGRETWLLELAKSTQELAITVCSLLKTALNLLLDARAREAIDCLSVDM